MARKPVQTFHPLAVAESLKAQNDAIGVFIQKVSSVASIADWTDAEKLREVVKGLGAEAETVRAVLWPSDE